MGLIVREAIAFICESLSVMKIHVGARPLFRIVGERCYLPLPSCIDSSLVFVTLDAWSSHHSNWITNSRSVKSLSELKKLTFEILLLISYLNTASCGIKHFRSVRRIIFSKQIDVEYGL